MPWLGRGNKESLFTKKPSKFDGFYQYIYSAERLGVSISISISIGSFLFDSLFRSIQVLHEFFEIGFLNFQIDF